MELFNSGNLLKYSMASTNFYFKFKLFGSSFFVKYCKYYNSILAASYNSSLIMFSILSSFKTILNYYKKNKIFGKF